jgi:acyl carrier protein
MSLIAADHACVRFGGTEVLHDISLRVEPGEIESIICQHPAVREALVTLRDAAEGSSSGSVLAGYVVIEPGTEYDPDEILAFMRARLPGALVPTRLVRLDQIPLLPSGKVDWQKLPVPESPGSSLTGENGATLSAPRSELERELACMWEELLGVPRVGIHDNFFRLGGHSLLATQLASRIRNAYHVEISLRKVFETPTVAGVAQEITQALAEQADQAELDLILGELESLPDGNDQEERQDIDSG